jgi:hypothetical protein
VIEMPVMLSEALPVFLSVTVLVVLVVLIAIVSKLKVVGDSETVGALLKLNVAVTNLDELIVTEQLAVPTQAPLQPAKTDPDAAFAVRATTVPLANDLLHVVGQLMPAGLLVTVPVPLPAKVAVSGKTNLNVAVADFDAVIVTEQEPVPEQAPLQPVKMEPAVEFALRVTLVPSEKPRTHLPGQFIPVGLLVTDP